MKNQKGFEQKYDEDFEAYFQQLVDKEKEEDEKKLLRQVQLSEMYKDFYENYQLNQSEDKNFIEEIAEKFKKNIRDSRE